MFMSCSVDDDRICLKHGKLTTPFFGVDKECNAFEYLGLLHDAESPQNI